MKCICGYEQEGKWTLEGYINTVGDEPFIKIMTEHNFKIENPNECEDGDYDYQRYLIVGLFACPKCKTIQFE